MSIKVDSHGPTCNPALRRTRLSSREMDKKFRRETKLLSRVHMINARDCYNCILTVGFDPIEFTLEKIDAAYNNQMALGQTSAWARRLGWITALHAFPVDYQAVIGADRIEAARRGSLRTVSPAAGEYPAIENGIDDVAAHAVQPPSSDCDPHTQRSVAGLERARTRALIVAKRLIDAGLATKALTLDELLSTEMQEKYIRLAYGVVIPSDADFADLDESGDPGHEPSLAFRLSDDVDSLRLLSSAKYGPHSKQADYARYQCQLYRHPRLDEGAVNVLTFLTQPEQLRKIRDLAHVWLARAETATHWKSRARWADLAATASIGRTMLPRPGDLAAMRIDGDGQPIVRCRHTETVGELKAPEDVRAIILRRNNVRGIAAGNESWLHPAGVGPQLERSVSKGFAEAADAEGLHGMTLQRQRDVGAIVMIRSNPGNFRAVATMMDYSEIRTAQRRFRAFLEPKKGKSS